MKRNRKLIVVLFAFFVSFAAATHAREVGGFDLDVLVDGVSRDEYHARGRVYVEAIRGEEYALRLTNPTPWRVAVALSVDGLNTIDAKRTPARDASKWVIEPWDEIVISGWQVNNRTARRFYFTGETDSYGAMLGQTENLGVISAVVFRERPREVYHHHDGRRDRSAPGAAGEGSESERAAPSAKSAESRAQSLDDDYAATGMGGRTRHEVRSVYLDLEPEPIASIQIRYEFRPQLVELGVLPDRSTPLERREKASGFDHFCPEPD